MAIREFLPEAAAFFPPLLLSTPSPLFQADEWATFTLSAHPEDPSGTIPRTYSVTRIKWADWRTIMLTETPPRTAFSLDSLNRPQEAQTLLANLAPMWAVPITERPLETFTVRFDCRTEIGFERMQELRALCVRSAFSEPSPDQHQGQAGFPHVLHLLDEVNAVLRAFDVAPCGCWDIREEIERAQREMLEHAEQRERASRARERERPDDWLPLNLPTLHGAVGDGRPKGNSEGQSVVVTRPLGSACLVDLPPAEDPVVNAPLMMAPFV